PTAASAPLEVEAEADDRSVRATVRNRGDEPLADVSLLAGTHRSWVGALAPGEERTVQVPAGAVLRVIDPWSDDLAPRPGPQGLPEPPGSLAMLLRWEVLDRHPGLVWALATTDRQLGDGAVVADGRAANELGTLLVVGARPRPAGAVPPIAVQRTVTAVSGHGGGDPLWLSTTAVEGVESVVLRFRLPAVGEVTAVTGTLQRGFQEPGFVPPDGIPRPVPVPAVTCDPNGLCVEAVEPVAPVLPPELRDPAGPVDLRPVELFDLGGQRWVPLAEAFQAGQADPARFLTPLGEVHVRGSASGVFDLSARGVGAVLAGGG
ncbi:MAG TPA: hypothetical protein VHF25_10680, partial [Nitriliruptorales bacterium]|nr:hypothetical protein [Nitriliruptorales bacterium]